MRWSPRQVSVLGTSWAPGRSPRTTVDEACVHGLTWLCDLQGYCWDSLNVPADLLLHRPLSTSAGEACSAESVHHARAVPELTLASVLRGHRLVAHGARRSTGAAAAAWAQAGAAGAIPRSARAPSGVPAAHPRLPDGARREPVR